jgi:carboxylesterase
MAIGSTINPDVKLGVMLLHGLTGVPSEMKYMAKHLERIGCIVDMPLIAGHGAGHKELLATGSKEWLAGVQESLETFSQRCDGVIVSGLSMGAILAALVAVDTPKVWGIVPMSPTIKYDGASTGTNLEFLLPVVDPVTFYWPHLLLD